MPDARFYALADAGAREAYADLAAVSAQATPFSSLAFADAACAAFGLDGHLLLSEAGDSATGGLLVFEKQRGPFRAAALPPYAEWVTPLLRAPLKTADVHRHATPLDRLAQALGERVHQATLRLHPTLADPRPLAWAGWTLTPAFHMEAPLDGATPTAAWRSHPRKLVRRHADEVQIDQGPEHIPAVVALAAESMEAKGMGHPDRAACARLAQGLVEAGLATVFVARPTDGGGPMAGGVFAHDGETAYYWMVGSRPGPAMTVLVAHVAGWLAERGHTRLHLGGANVPSVAEFKRGLGGELMPVVRARWSRGPLRLRDAWASVRA